MSPLEAMQRSCAAQYPEYRSLNLDGDGRRITVGRLPPIGSRTRFPPIGHLANYFFDLVIKDRNEFDLYQVALVFHINMHTYSDLLEMATGESADDLLRLPWQKHVLLMPMLFLVNRDFFFEVVARVMPQATQSVNETSIH